MAPERRIIAWDHAQIREDHERLHELVTRLRMEPDRALLATLLVELPQRLDEHFRREEEPGGFYEAVGVSLGEARGEIGRLVDDHFRLVSMARDIAEQAASPDVPTAALREQAARVCDYLMDHEQRERDLARAMVEGA